jgi:cold shock protein
LRSPKNDRPRQPRRRGFEDDNFYDNAPSPPSLAGFGGVPSTPEVRGLVKWYNAEKGFGFVELADGSGDVFLHVNTLQAAGHQDVGPGMTLQVRVGQGQKGRQVDQVLSVDESTAKSPVDARGARPRMERASRRQVDLSSAIEMAGIVKWYNPDKGFGFITPSAGGKDVFIHATALERAGLSPLQEGQPVRMSVVQGTKGPEVGSIGLD